MESERNQNSQSLHASGDKLKQALNRLPADDRELLWMRCIEQLSLDEIQAVMEISERQVKFRIRTALQKLQGYMR